MRSETGGIDLAREAWRIYAPPELREQVAVASLRDGALTLGVTHLQLDTHVYKWWASADGACFRRAVPQARQLSVVRL